MCGDKAVDWPKLGRAGDPTRDVGAGDERRRGGRHSRRYHAHWDRVEVLTEKVKRGVHQSAEPRGQPSVATTSTGWRKVVDGQVRGEPTLNRKQA